MQWVSSSHPPGVIGVTGGELARYHAFTAAWSRVFAPMGTNEAFCLGYDTSYNSNDVIKALWAKDAEGEPINPDAQWVWIMDDDHTFEQETLIRLLDRNVDVVVPLYTQRQPPFFPCAFKQEYEDGTFEIFRWEDLEGTSGLLPVISAGKGGVLIRKHVIEKLGSEWFERRGKMGEDHLFFKKCREAGFGVYVDLDTRLDHLTPIIARPHRDEAGRWCGQIDLKRGVTVEFWSAAYQSSNTQSTGGMGPVGVAALNAV